ncbi:MAG: Rad52/Rad22 family DNA repair protein [Filifactoraceae bacterium]
MKNLREELMKPFKANELEYKVGATNADKTKGLALTYVQARAIQNRLDEVVGFENWRVSYKEIEKGYLATLEIRIGGEWIAKQDGANQTDFEAIKGGISSAFKRVASVWGIGRYLYDVESQWLPIKSKGKGYDFVSTPNFGNTQQELKVETNEEIIEPKQEVQKQPETKEEKTKKAKSMIIPFGKFKGKTLEQVLGEEETYLKFLAQTSKDKKLANACKFLMSLSVA